MKHLTPLLSLFIFLTLSGCDAPKGVKPRAGDAVLYDYTVKNGDTIVFKSAKREGDTAMMIVEAAAGKEPIAQALMDNLIKLSPGDSASFDVANAGKGVLKLFRVIPAGDFPKFIEEAQQREKVFEQELQNVGQSIRDNVPFFKNRRKAVLDSVTMLTQQFRSGQLTGKFRTLPTGIQYWVIKGSGNVLPARKKMVWFHYASVLRGGNKTADSYQIMPRTTNLAEFELTEEVEKSAASFEDGTIVLILLPPKAGESNKSLADLTPADYTVCWIEVIKSLKMP